MTVKELINELVECDMNDNVEIMLKTHSDDDYFEFEVFKPIRFSSEVKLVVDSKYYELIDKESYDKLTESDC